MRAKSHLRHRPVSVFLAGWSVAALATTGGLLAVAWQAAHLRSSAPLLITWAATFVPYSLLTVLPMPRSPRAALGWTLGCAAVGGLGLAAAPVRLSDDVFRYLWDARVTLSGVDPYAYAPADPALSHLRDSAWTRINHPALPTAYPPLAQASFVLAAALWADVRAFKLMALVAHLSTTCLVYRVAAVDRSRAALVYGLNPLVSVEAALAGHIDALVAGALVGFVAAFGQRRFACAAVLAGVASGVKLIGLVLAPLFARASKRALACALVLVLLPLVPFARGAAGGGSTGLTHYAQRWQGNAFGFGVLEYAARALLDTCAAGSDSAPELIEGKAVRTLLRVARSGGFDPGAVVRAEKKPSPRAGLPRHYVEGVVARGLAALCALCFAWWAVRRLPGWSAVAVVRNLLLIVLLLAPQVHPWYLLWLVPMEVLHRRAAGLVWSATVLLAYAPLDAWRLRREWTEPPLLLTLEYLPVLLVLALELPWVQELCKKVRPATCRKRAHVRVDRPASRV